MNHTLSSGVTAAGEESSVSLSCVTHSHPPPSTFLPLSPAVTSASLSPNRFVVRQLPSLVRLSHPQSPVRGWCSTVGQLIRNADTRSARETEARGERVKRLISSNVLCCSRGCACMCLTGLSSPLMSASVGVLGSRHSLTPTSFSAAVARCTNLQSCYTRDSVADLPLQRLFRCCSQLVSHTHTHQESSWATQSVRRTLMPEGLLSRRTHAFCVSSPPAVRLEAPLTVITPAAE